MRLPHLTTLAFLSLSVFLKAQDGTMPGIEEEHRYHFNITGTISPATEKTLVEAMLGFDERMHVDIDRPYNLMKVLAYQPIDPQVVISLAAQFGVPLTPRRVNSTAPERPNQLQP